MKEKIKNLFIILCLCSFLFAGKTIVAASCSALSDVDNIDTCLTDGNTAIGIKTCGWTPGDYRARWIIEGNTVKCVPTSDLVAAGVLSDSPNRCSELSDIGNVASCLTANNAQIGIKTCGWTPGDYRARWITEGNTVKCVPESYLKSSDFSLDKYLKQREKQDQLLIDNLINSLQQSQIPDCPLNSTEIGNQCIIYTQSCQSVNNNDPNIVGNKDENGKINCNCISGYFWNGNKCITYTQSCQNNYGPNSYGDKEYCYCSADYEFNPEKTACIKSIICNDGYIMKNNTCITYTEDCIQSFGNNVYGTKGTNNNSFCSCNSGYEWSTRTTCIKTVICLSNSIKVNNVCVCNNGYEWDSTKTDCVKEEVKNIAQHINQPEEIFSTSSNEKGNEIVNKVKSAQPIKVSFIKSFSNFLASISSAFKGFFSKIFK